MVFITFPLGCLLIWDFFLNIVPFKKLWIELNCEAVCCREKGAFSSFCSTVVIDWSIRAVGYPVWRELHLWYIWLLKNNKCIFGVIRCWQPLWTDKQAAQVLDGNDFSSCYISFQASETERINPVLYEYH